MRILQLISSAGYYGAENMLINLAQSLSHLGCDCIVGVFNNLHTPNTEIVEHARRRGLPVEIFSCRGRVDRNVIRAIRTYLQEQKIDILHAHGYKADLYGYLAAKDLRIPRIATCHNWSIRALSLRAYAFLDRIVLRGFHKVVAVSESVADSLRDFGIPKYRLTIIDNGVDLPCFDSASPTLAEKIQKGTRTLVGMVGRLVPEKGPEYFLRAARGILVNFPDTLFVLVGDGPARKELEELAAALMIKNNVIFAGQCRDMPGVYASMDIVVLPSLREGLPITILEAMAAKKPIVATRVGAIPKLISRGASGILVEPADTVGLQDAITHLLKNPQLREIYGSNGQRFVRERFSAQVMAQNYLNLYQNFFDGRGEVGKGPLLSRNFANLPVSQGRNE